MTSITRTFVLAMLLLSSCAAPLYERARIDKGVSFGAGVAAFKATSEFADLAGGVEVTGFWREGLSERLAYGLQATAVGYFGVDAWGFIGSGSGKWRFSRSQALLVSAGFPHVVGIDLLQDVGDLITFRISAGCDPGVLERHANIGCAVDLHPTRGDWTYHFSGNICHLWAGGEPGGFVGTLGVAFELLEGP